MWTKQFNFRAHAFHLKRVWLKPSLVSFPKGNSSQFEDASYNEIP